MACPACRAELGEQGVRVGGKRIARLMRAAELHGVSKRRGFVVTTQRDTKQCPAPDLVKREFKADGPNQLWVADMTFVPTWAGFIYLAIVLDVWSRRVVGWSIGERMLTDLVLAAPNMALAQRKPCGVIHHSDQGSTPASPLTTAAPRWAYARRWAAWATPTTTHLRHRPRPSQRTGRPQAQVAHARPPSEAAVVAI